MPFKRTALIAVFILLTGAHGTCVAQFRSGLMSQAPPSVLSPAPSEWWIGPQLGAGLNSHSGDFVTDFCNCAFEDGSGVGFTAGAEVGHFLSPAFAVALKLVFNDLRAKYSYRLIMPTVVVNEPEEVDLEYERQNTVTISYLMLNPVLEFYPFGGLYVLVGPAVGLRTAANEEYILTLVDEGYRFEVGDPTSQVVKRDTGELPGAESFRADLRVGIGYNLRLGRNFIFAPEFSYAYPLTRISNDDNWFAESFQIIGVFKFEL